MEVNIINSSITPSGPAEVYAGFEPLAAVTPWNMAQHFEHTLMPEKTELVSKKTTRKSSALVKKYKKMLRAYQDEGTV